MLEQLGEQHHGVVVDKFRDPVADYQMTTRDYVVRPDSSEILGTLTVTLPPVAEAAGRFYSIAAANADMQHTVIITNRGDSEGWEGDIELYETGQSQLFYSDGLKWMLRSFADIEIEASPRGLYGKAAGITGELAAGRFRAEGRKTTTGSAPTVYAVHAQGMAYESCFASVVNALYVEAMVKPHSTIDNIIRGAMIQVNTEGSAPYGTIVNMVGAHIRTYTDITPSGYYRTLMLEHEQWGSAHVALNEFIKIIDSVFHAVDTVAAYGLRMLTTGIITTGISLESPMVTGISVQGYCSGLCLDIDKTSSLVAGNIRAADITLTMDTTSNVNQVEALRVQIATGAAVNTGAWANVIFAQLDYGVGALAWGIGSVICAELSLPGSAVTHGHYAVFNAEIDCPLNCAMGGNPISIINASVWGDAKTQFDDVGLLFDINGVVSGAGNFYYENAVALQNCDAFLKISVNDKVLYIPLLDNQAGT